MASGDSCFGNKLAEFHLQIRWTEVHASNPASWIGQQMNAVFQLLLLLTLWGEAAGPAAAASTPRNLCHVKHCAATSHLLVRRGGQVAVWCAAQDR